MQTPVEPPVRRHRHRSRRSKTRRNLRYVFAWSAVACFLLGLTLWLLNRPPQPADGKLPPGLEEKVGGSRR